MINSGVFNYVNILDRAADASWARNEVLNNNISNATTPGYKRKDIRFESYLENELRGSGSLDQKVDRIKLKNLNYTTYTDLSNYRYRLDGSNVDMSMEQAELASEQIRYNALTTAINSEFTRLKTAMMS
ncbi:MAG: flagellar basal body rod protein FlgB [Lachnospiraceae bacterium]|nr:flagellar basal body rod protein FlgB [Lachnospiraceae bacterium]